MLPNLIKLRLPIPKKIQDAPSLSPGLELYWDAFEALNTCRSGMSGDGPIPWLAVRRYADHCDMDGQECDDLWFFMQRMDEAYQKLASSKRGKS